MNIIIWKGETIDKKHILEEIKRKRDVFYRIYLGENIYWVNRKKLKTLLPIIINELKPYFGFKKDVILTMKNQHGLYILYKMKHHTDEYEVLDIKDKQNDIVVIRSIFAFKILMGSEDYNNSSITIRKEKYHFQENEKTRKDSINLPAWFEINPKGNIEESVKSLLVEKSDDDWMNIIDKTSRKIKKMLGVKFENEILKICDEISNNIISYFNFSV